MAQVVDCSYTYPGAAAIARAGYTGCIRYLSYQPVKNMQSSQIRDLHDHGLSAGVVWETTASRAADGWQAGSSDARAANLQADALGWPADLPIYYAVDLDAQPYRVTQYFDGVRQSSVRPWGVYGSWNIIEAFADKTPWLWQCAAWSRGRRSAHAKLYQYAAPVMGGACDVNDVLGDAGLWTPNHSPSNTKDALDMADPADVINPLTLTIAKGFTDDAVRQEQARQDIIGSIVNVQNNLAGLIRDQATATQANLSAALTAALTAHAPAGTDIGAVVAAVAAQLQVTPKS